MWVGKGYAGLWRLLQLGRRLDASGAPGSSLRRPRVLGTPPSREAGALLSPPTAGRGAGSAARGPRSRQHPPAPPRALAPRSTSQAPWAPAWPAAASSARSPAAPAAFTGSGAALSAPGTGRRREWGPRPGGRVGRGRRRGCCSFCPRWSARRPPTPARRKVPCQPKPGGCLCTGCEKCLLPGFALASGPLPCDPQHYGSRPSARTHPPATAELAPRPRAPIGLLLPPPRVLAPGRHPRPYLTASSRGFCSHPSNLQESSGFPVHLTFRLLPLRHFAPHQVPLPNFLPV